MLPQKFKDMFGLKDQKDMKMANNIWKMLDEMSSNDPQAYQKFIQKNLTQGLTDAKAQKQKKQKPYKITPHQYMLLQMDAVLHQQYLIQSQSQIKEQLQFKQKLDININKQKWSDVRNKFEDKIHIMLNICHSQRVKKPTSRSNGGKEIGEFNVSMMKDIQNLYYSLQGPHFQNKEKEGKEKEKEGKNIWYFCMIFNTGFINAFQAVPNGKRVFLGICVAYFQERIKADRNPILMKVNVHSLYGKNLYYSIDKNSIQLNQNKKFKYGQYTKACQFLLQKQIDSKQREQPNPKKQQQKKQKQIQTKLPQSQQPPSSQLPPLIPTSNPKSQKKVLIQVLQQKQTPQKTEQDTSIPFEMKQTQQGYYFQFLIPGIQKIQDLDLQVSRNVIKLKTVASDKPVRSLEIKLIKNIDQNNVKAKIKKKIHKLIVNLCYDK